MHSGMRERTYGIADTGCLMCSKEVKKEGASDRHKTRDEDDKTIMQ